MSQADFMHLPERRGTLALKLEARQAMFGRADVLPLWVADMDFAAPDCVRQALIARAEHPIYGYTVRDPDMLPALCDWIGRRHGWRPDPAHACIAPGVVPSLYAAVAAFTQAGEGVIVQTPVYPPFFQAVQVQGRRLVENPLHCADSVYRFDLDHFEQCARQARLLLLCSPHNPVGRVWRRDELQELLAICARHDVIVFADEIHADLLYPGEVHYPALPLARERVVAAWAPSKTFNIPGMGLSALICEQADLLARLQAVFAALPVSTQHPFGQVAWTAAYRQAEPWLEALLQTLHGHRQHALARLQQELPGLRVSVPQATYLLWLNFQAWGLSEAELVRRLVDVAGLGLNPGSSFGAAGRGCMRLNMATARAQLDVALDRLIACFA